MEQIGYVCKVVGDIAEVEVRRISGCGGGCGGCSGGCDAPSIVVTMKNIINAQAGDFVKIKAKPENIIKYALIVYMIPFVMLIVGVTIGVRLFGTLKIENNETYGFMFGLLFLITSFIIVKRIDKYIKSKDENAMEMIRILNQDEIR